MILANSMEFSPKGFVLSETNFYIYLFSQFSVRDKQHVCETNTVCMWQTGSMCETACVWETNCVTQCVIHRCIYETDSMCVHVCEVWNMYLCVHGCVYTCACECMCVHAGVWGGKGGWGGGGDSACMGMKEQGGVEARETLTTEQWASKVNLASRIKHWGWQKNLASALPCDTTNQNASHISTNTCTNTHTDTHEYSHTHTYANTHTHAQTWHTTHTSRHHTNWRTTDTCTATLHPHTWTHWHHTHALTSRITHICTHWHTHQDLPNWHVIQMHWHTHICMHLHTHPDIQNKPVHRISNI